MSRRRENSALLGMGVSNDVVDGVLSALDFLGLGVRDVDGELVFDVENELNLFEGVEAKILLEVRVGRNGVGVDLVEALDDLYNASRDLLVGKSVVLTVEARKSGLNLGSLSGDHARMLDLRGGLVHADDLEALGETRKHDCVDDSTFHRALTSKPIESVQNPGVFR